MLRTDRQEVLLVLRLAWLELSLSRAAECEYVLSIGTQRPPTLLLACSACGTTTGPVSGSSDITWGGRTSNNLSSVPGRCPRSPHAGRRAKPGCAERRTGVNRVGGKLGAWMS